MIVVKSPRLIPAKRSREEDAWLQALETIGEGLRDPWWRITSGAVYKIMTKGNEDEPGAIVPFIPNEAQTDFLRRIWTRNVIVKGRQLGFTTLKQIYQLDHALFVANQRVGTVAHELEAVKAIFRDKVRLAYRNLPPVLQEAFPLKQENESELLFAHNNSSFRVATSFTSSTIHRLHVSELGKMGKEAPLKAKEVMEGTIPTVPPHGVVTIESTSEGPSGPLHDVATTAERHRKERKPLDVTEYRLHFYPWYSGKEYRSPTPQRIRISPAEHEYFDLVESKAGVKLDLAQRAWWVSTRDSTYNRRSDSMWRQYPSTLDECWQTTTEGVIFKNELAAVRLQQRLRSLPFVSNVPVNSAWDIGSNDGTGIWLHQKIGAEHRILAYIEGWFTGFATFIAKMDEFSNEFGPFVWGTHYLPHDAESLRQTAEGAKSAVELLRGLKPGWKWTIVPRVPDLAIGIEQTRAMFPVLVFDSERCKEGFAHLEQYRRRFNRSLNAFTDEVHKDEHTEAADALRQLAQGWVDDGGVRAGDRPNRGGTGASAPAWRRRRG
jgi:hypothetical protein